MRIDSAQKKLSTASVQRLCHYCNEGHCALCTGFDRTIVDGRIVEIPCAHGCRQDQGKPVRGVAPLSRGARKRA